MKKYFLLMILAFSTAFIMLRADAEGVILCPAIDDIKINFFEQTATAKGGWVGSTIISLKHRHDWRNMSILIEVFKPLPKAQCMFYITAKDGGFYSIFLERTIPRHYFLYSITSIYPTVGNCFDYGGYPYHCYYYDHHI